MLQCVNACKNTYKLDKEHAWVAAAYYSNANYAPIQIIAILARLVLFSTTIIII